MQNRLTVEVQTIVASGEQHEHVGMLPDKRVDLLALDRIHILSRAPTVEEASEISRQQERQTCSSECEHQDRRRS